MPRIIAAAAAVLALMAGVTLTSASAARLDVTAGFQAFAASESSCAPAMSEGAPVIKAAVGQDRWRGASSHVKVNSIPANCVGLPFELLVHNQAGTVLASATGTTANPLNVRLSSYQVAQVAKVVMRIDGWVFPTQWANPGPEPAMICEAVDTAGNVVESHSCTVTASHMYVYRSMLIARGEAFDFSVSWDANPPSNVRWRVKFDLAHPHFSPEAMSWIATPGLLRPPFELSSGFSCSALPELSFTSRSNAELSNQTVRVAGSRQTLVNIHTLCG